VRTLALPKVAALALAVLDRFTEDDHVFVYPATGKPLTAARCRREFDKITKAAGLGTDWTPRELRHSFVSIMSDHGVPIEQIADLVGHSGTNVTEHVYRHQISPVIQSGADAMDAIFPALGALLGPQRATSTTP
jgi:integrase